MQSMWKIKLRKNKREPLKQKLWNRIKEEQGSATVEGSIWIPVVFFVVMMLIVLSLQWMEMGIVQGEMLITSSNAICYVDSEEEEGTSSENKKDKIHFIKDANWNISEGKKEWKGRFEGSTKIVGKKRKVVRRATARKEHPIEMIRRRKRFEEAISR